MSKNIVICCDGTGNRPDDTEAGISCASNVYRFYNALLNHPDSQWQQVKWYDPGVGTDSSAAAQRFDRIGKRLRAIGQALPAGLIKALGMLRQVVELATGAGITENITQAYTELVRQYEPGDRIYLIGFSRGAYTARCLAGIIARTHESGGLLKADQIRYAADVVRMYRHRQRPSQQIALDEKETVRIHKDVCIRFLGVWDTVASLGLPLWGWWFAPRGLWSNRGLEVSCGVGATCEQACHALSMDEQRSQFFPTLFDELANSKARVEQVWFRGTHAGVGGGYADSGLSDISLQWMMDKARAAGLLFADAQCAKIKPDPLGEVHNELQRRPEWNIFGSWPRWHPCVADGVPAQAGFGTLHESVFRRAQHAADRRKQRMDECAVTFKGAPRCPQPTLAVDELVSLGKSRDHALVCVRADQIWNRTGVVIEPGSHYRVTYVGGKWQDRLCEICGPAGQNKAPMNVHSMMHRMLGWRRRVPKAHPMELIAYVASPRKWKLQEKSARELLKYMIWEDPQELVGDLQRLGRKLAAPGDSCVFSVPAHVKHAGMLYLFANDDWMFYGNNSGSVTLKIEPIENTPADESVLVVGGH